MNIEIEQPTADFDVSMPKFGFKGKKAKAPKAPNAETPTAEIQTDFSAPSVDIDIEKPSGQFDVNMPNISLPKFGMKGKTPKSTLKGDVDLPGLDVETTNLSGSGEISGPSVDIDIEKPTADFDVSMPKMKMPSFGLKGKGSVDAPSANIDVKSPSASLQVESKSKINDAELDGSLKTPKKKFKGPACLQGERPDPHLLKLRGPKVEGEVKTPKMKSSKGDLSLHAEIPSLPHADMTASAQGIGINGEINAAGKKPKFSGLSCLEGEKPDPYLLKLQGPKMDLGDRTSPKAKLELEKPKGGLDLPEVKVPSADFNFSMPSLKKSGSKGEIHSKAEISLPDAAIRGPEIKVATPSASVEESKNKSKGFSCLGDKGDKPDPYLLRLQGPKVEEKEIDGQVSVEGGKIEIDVSVPRSDANLSAPKLKKKSKISGPSCFQGEKPDPYLLKLQGPKLEKVESGKLDASVKSQAPSLDLKPDPLSVELHGPKAEISSNLPKVSTEKPDIEKKHKFKGPSCLQGEKPDPHLLKLQGPKADVEGEIELQAPSSTISVQGGDADAGAKISVPDKKGKFKGPSCLQGEKPDPHLLKLQGPKADVEGDVGLQVSAGSKPVQSGEAEAKISVPEKKGKFKGPSCLQGEKPDPHLLKLQGPKIDVEVNEQLSDANVQVKPTLASAEVKLDGSKDIPKKDKKRKGVSCLQGEKPDPHLLKLKGPKVEASAELPTANIDASSSKVPVAIVPDQQSIEIGADLAGKKEVKKSKFKGPSCLQGEKPDPYLLKLQGPKMDISAEEETKISVPKLDAKAPNVSIEVEKPVGDQSITLPTKKADIDAGIKVAIEEPTAKVQSKPKKIKGPSCLQGEKPDPHLLKLQGPHIETEYVDVKKSSLKRPSSVKADSNLDTGVSVSAKAAKIDVNEPHATLKTEKPKEKSTTCWKGSESPDPYLLRLQGPKLDSSDAKTGSLKIDHSKPEISTKSRSLPVKTESPCLEASEVVVKTSKKQKGPSCLKGEADLEPSIPSSSKDLTFGKPSETKKFKMPKFHISSEHKDQANLTPVLGPEGRTTFAIMESPDIDFVTPKLQVTPKLPKANKESTKQSESEGEDTTPGSRFHFKGFNLKKKAKVPETKVEVDSTGTPTKRSPFKMPKVSISKKKQSHSVTAFPDVDVQFPYIDSSEPQVSVDAPGTPPHLTLSALRRLGSTDEDELSGSKTLPTSRRGQRESVTTSWPKIRSSGGSLGDDVDSAGASPESTLKPKSPSLHGSNVSIKYYFVDTPFSATEIEIPDVSSDPHSQLKLTETSSGIIVMETTHTSVSHGGDSSALDVDASFSTDSLPLESHYHYTVDSAQLDFDDGEGPPSTTPSPFSTLPAGVSPQHATFSATNILQSSHTYKEETSEYDSKMTNVSVMAAMGDTEAVKPSASVKVSETESEELLDSIKQELDWTT